MLGVRALHVQVSYVQAWVRLFDRGQAFSCRRRTTLPGLARPYSNLLHTGSISVQRSIGREGMTVLEYSAAKVEAADEYRIFHRQPQTTRTQNQTQAVEEGSGFL